MQLLIISKRLEWDAGHRVLHHEGRCKHLHGHRYAAEIFVTARELDQLGRVIDFSVIKRLVGGWIDKHWDHNILLHADDPLLRFWFDHSMTTSLRDEQIEEMSTTSDAIFGGKDPFVFKSEQTGEGMNPTAENIARVLFKLTHDLLMGHCIEVIRVKVWETPTSTAEVLGDPIAP